MRIFLLILLCVIKLDAQDFKINELVKNIDTPWEILWGPDNYIWMTERYGRVSRVNPSSGEVLPLITITDVYEDFERGLMGMVLHPNFSTEPFVYVVYTTGDNTNTTIRIVRYKYTGTNLIEPFVLMEKIHGFKNHIGSRLWIDKNMKLFATIGDAADKTTSQNKLSINGKILRMNLDGTVPTDNPFVNNPEFNPYIYTWGHRNPQGLVFANDKIYSSEHGETTNDELNLIEVGRNYGWPLIEGDCDKAAEIILCDSLNLKAPMKSYYINSTVATAGIDFYNKDLFPNLKNNILMTTLKGSQLFAIRLDNKGEKVISDTTLILNKYGRLRDICISPEGKIYVATSNKDGRAAKGFDLTDYDKILELVPLNSDIKEENLKTTIYNNFSDITVQHKENINSIQIFDLMGRVVFTQKELEANMIRIDKSQFNSNSIVFIVINGEIFKHIIL